MRALRFEALRGGGPTAAATTLGPACAECQDFGWVRDAEGRMVRCACRRNDDALRIHDAACAEIPPRWRHRTRDDWVAKFGPWPRLAPAVDPLWTESAWAVTLLGPTGTGKTTLASILFAEAMLSGRYSTSAWLSTQEALERVREEMDDNGGNPRGSTRKRLYDADVLLLDDLGSERGTEFELELLRGTLTHRYNWRKPTIVTSNAADAVELDRISGARVSSRLTESGETLLVVLDGEDRRLG